VPACGRDVVPDAVVEADDGAVHPRVQRPLGLHRDRREEGIGGRESGGRGVEDDAVVRLGQPIGQRQVDEQRAADRDVPDVVGPQRTRPGEAERRQPDGDPLRQVVAAGRVVLHADGVADVPVRDEPAPPSGDR
jgi:hypothetical protein